MVQPAEEKTSPSLLLALVSALIVSEFNRHWLSGPVKDQIPEGGPSPERLSRLKARLLAPFEALIDEATRRGRPPRHPEASDESLLLRELLALVPRRASTYLSCQERGRLVAAQERLAGEHGLRQQRFCELLGISPRTFRSWKRPAPRPTPETAPASLPPPATKRPRQKTGAGRFDLEVTLPGLQAIADTTDWEILGVPLKIVAAQDPGKRKERLWESFAVSITEDAALVVEVLEEVAAENPGLQVITDQGSPYMAELTREALDTLECELAPQKEGTPTEKATKERAFKTVKDALSPLVALSRKLAERFPALKRPDLAQPLGRLLLSVFLRVYEAAPRDGAHPLAGRAPVELEAIAEAQRDRARAEDRSKRLFLTEVHHAYDFPGAPARTIRAHRRHALEDLREAERRLRAKGCRCQTKACDRYFAGIVRNVAEANRRRREEERRRCLAVHEQLRLRQASAESAVQRAAMLRDTPERVIAEALELIGCQWIPQERALFAEGRGIGTGRLRQALESMQQHDQHTALDRAEAAWTHWLQGTKHRRDADRVAAVRATFERTLAPFAGRDPPSLRRLVMDRITPRPSTTDPPPVRWPGLRNSPAGSWG